MAIRLAYLFSFLFLFLYSIFTFFGIGLSLEPGMEIGGISRWCERVSDSIFREPVNTLTNLAFYGDWLDYVSCSQSRRRKCKYFPYPDSNSYSVCLSSYFFGSRIIFNARYSYRMGWMG